MKDSEESSKVPLGEGELHPAFLPTENPSLNLVLGRKEPAYYLKRSLRGFVSGSGWHFLWGKPVVVSGGGFFKAGIEGVRGKRGGI